MQQIVVAFTTYFLHQMLVGWMMTMITAVNVD